MNPPPWLHDLALLILRLAFGGLMLLEHGLGKLDKLLGGGIITFKDPLGVGAETSLALATATEVGGAALLVLGLFTRLSALSLAFTMGVAAFLVHAGDPLSKREPALLYLAAYLALLAFGPGRFSLSQALSRVLPKRGILGFLAR